MRPLLSLVMIVKDEAASIRATLESVRPFVDRWCILDTGSTDDTEAIIADAMAGVTGFLGGEEFIDFATTRNAALECTHRFAREGFDPGGTEPAIFALMLSGGETLADGPALRAFLETQRDTTANAFHVKVQRGDLTFYYPHVLRVGGPFRYEGAVHELPVNPNDPNDLPVLAPGVVCHAPDSPAKRQRTLRERNLPALERMLAEGTGNKARVLLHLAQTYEGLADAAPKDQPGGEYLTLLAQAMAAYMRRMELGGAIDEVNLARFGALNCGIGMGLYHTNEILSHLAVLMEEMPRPEVYYLNAVHVAKTRRFLLGYRAATDAILVARAARERVITLTPVDHSCLWRSHLIAARCAKALGKESDVLMHADAGIAAGGPREAFWEYLA